MKLANMVGERFKERPSDCVIDSQAFSVRGGYISASQKIKSNTEPSKWRALCKKG